MSTYLEELKKLVLDQTDKVGTPIANIYGVAAAPLSKLTSVERSTWLVLTTPGRSFDTLEQFYVDYASLEGTTTRLLETDTGAVVWTHTGLEQVTMLVRGALDVPNARAVSVAVQADDPQAEFRLFVDGSERRQGYGGGEVAVFLEAGAHLIEVLVAANTAGVKVPPDVRVRGDFERVSPPSWSTVSTGYVDDAQGQPQVTLAWFSDVRAGGWRVLRRQMAQLSVVTAVSAADGNRLFTATLAGDQSAVLLAGAELRVVGDLMGTVVSVLYDGAATGVRIRLPASRAAPNPNWVDRTAYKGSFAEVQRVGRTTASGEVSWRDTAVAKGRLYEYALQAWGYLDANSWSALSAVRPVVAGDSVAPAPIAFLATYPHVVNRRVYVRFTTPVDTDYAGVRVYYRQKKTGTATSAASTSITDSGADFTGVDSTWKVRITAGTGSGQERDVASLTGITTVNVTLAWATTPNGTSAYRVFKDTVLITDYGLPGGVQDQFEFEPIDSLPTAPAQEYQFRAFDNGLNEQDDDAAASWTYTPSTDGTWTNPPIVGIRQVPTAEQVLFPAPYDNTTNYALIELSANDALDRKTGVTIFYQRRSDSVAVSLPATSAPATEGGTPRQLDVPAGTRSRYIAIDRTTDQNWVRVYAQDTDGNKSDKIVYSVDYDDQAEVASLEGRLDTFATYTADWNDLSSGNEFGSGTFGVQGMVRVTGAVDDDARSMRYWLEDGTGDDPHAFARDVFTDTDNTLLQNHGAGLGTPWAKHPSFSGDAQVSDAGRLHASSATEAVYYLAALPLSADYDVAAWARRRSATSGVAGIVGRLSASANTSYQAVYDDGADQWVLRKMVAGSATTLGTFAQALAIDQDYRVLLQMRGTAIKLFVDGVERIAVTDSAISAAGAVGVRFATAGGADATGLHLDEFFAGVARTLDLSTTRSFALAFSLDDGQRKNLVVEPWSNAAAEFPGDRGQQIQREFARTPRSSVHFEDRDENDNVTGARIKAIFELTPPAVQEYPPSGTAAVHASASTATTLKVASGTPWTPKQFRSIGRQKHFVISTPVTTGPVLDLETRGQIRLISDNVADILTVTPPWTAIPHGGQFRIVDGTVYYKLDGSENFQATSGYQFFDRKQDGPTLLEYYAAKNKCPDEGVKRVSVDADTIPTFNAPPSLTEPSPNTLRLTMSQPDDDVKYWRVYRRKAQVPTAWGGTVWLPSTGSASLSATASPAKYVRASGSFVTDGFASGMTVNATGFSNAQNNGISKITAVSATDLTVVKSGGLVVESAGSGKTVATALVGSDFERMYLHHGPIEVARLTYDSFAGTGVQYVAVVPTNALNEDGPPTTASIQIVGGGGGPALSDLRVDAADGGGGGYNTNNRVKWAHPNITGPGAGGNGSTTHKVRIFAKRRVWYTGLVDIPEAEIAAAFDPRYVPVDNADFDNAGDADTVANEGSFIHTGLDPRPAPGELVVLYTWTYRIQLWAVGGAQVGSDYVVEHTSGYVSQSSAVQVTSASFSYYGGSGVGFQCLTSPHNQVFWTTNNNNGGYSIAVEVCTDANPSTGSWFLAASGLTPSQGLWTDELFGFYETTGVTRRWTYRAWSYRTTDGPGVVQGSKWYTNNSTTAPTSPSITYQSRVCSGEA